MILLNTSVASGNIFKMNRGRGDHGDQYAKNSSYQVVYSVQCSPSIYATAGATTASFCVKFLFCFVSFQSTTHGQQRITEAGNEMANDQQINKNDTKMTAIYFELFGMSSSSLSWSWPQLKWRIGFYGLDFRLIWWVN